MKIGVFDSGYGGLTILQKIRQILPEYDYLYLGDNARAPYGSRSFEVIYQYTWQCVQYLFAQGCELVILACNTASAKALRSIQQRDLLHVWEQEGSQRKRVLGVIRPTVEQVTKAPGQHVGIIATPGTVSSESYVLELQHLDPTCQVTQQACPLFVPLIENGVHHTPGAQYFIHDYIEQLKAKSERLDSVILGCTHYPLIQAEIQAELGEDIHVIAQGDIVAESLKDYLQRHSELAACLSRGGTCHYLTTEAADKFSSSAAIFLSIPVTAEHIEL